MTLNDPHESTARLGQVQAELAELQRLAAHATPGGAAWAAATRASVPLIEEAARLQAYDGPPGAYRFPDSSLACDITADGGDVWERIGTWQETLGRVAGREALPEGGTGVVLRFPLDADLAGTLARLAAAEFRCCSFGSYTLVVDGAGLRLEIRMPDEAAGMLAAVVGG